MAKKPTYKELEQKVRELEAEYSKRKRAEEMLGETSKFVDKVISESPIGIAIYDTSGQCVAANDAIGKLIGATGEEVLAQNYNTIKSWKKSGLFDKVKSAVRENSNKRHELKVKSTFGRDVSLDCHLVPFSSEGQTHLLLMTNDIGERMRAEEALRRSEEEFRQMAGLSPFPISIIEPDGRYRYVNKKFTELFGYRLEDIPTGRDWFHKAYPDPEYRRKVISAWKSDLGKSVKYDVRPREFKVVCKDGTVRDIIFRPVSVDKGRQFITYEDLTERKKAEKALRESEAKYHSLYDTMKEGVAIHEVVYDASGEAKDYIVLDVNPAYEKILGLKKEKVMERKASELYGTGQAPYIAIYAKVAASRQPTSFETYFRPMDKHFSISAFSSRWGQFATVFADITERKRAEKQLLERQAALEAQTNELEEVNAALRVLLKRRDEDRTKLEKKVLSNVKELVLPYAEKLKKSRLDAKQKAYLSILESNLNGIISPFALTLSSTYVGLTPTEIEIAHLVKDGKTAKEIAEMLNVSVRTIEFHKKSIRRKLSLTNRKVNLRSHLLSITN